METAGFPAESDVLLDDSDTERTAGWDTSHPPAYTFGEGFAVLEPGEIIDSAHIQLQKPLYQHVLDHVDNWRAIGANAVVIDWIENGVHFDLLREIPAFYHTQITHTEDARIYWH